MDTKQNAILSLVGILFLAVGGWAVKAWALSSVWAWFIVPLGFPVIGMAHAAGVMLVADAIRGVSFADLYAIQQDKGNGKAAGRIFFASYCVPVILYGMAWIAHSFM